MHSLALLSLLASTSTWADTVGTGVQEASGGEFLGAGLPLLLAAVLYSVGAWRLYRRSRGGRRVRTAQSLAFAAGWVALALALLSPLDTLSGELFAVHMLQHETLMLIAAPLLVLGRPLPIFLWAFSARVRLALGHATQIRGVSRLWQGLTRPITAWALHALALWAWHAPRVFEAALINRGIHDFQRALLSRHRAVVLVRDPARARSRQPGVAVLYLFTTTIHTSVLGALITFGSHPWYAAYRDTALLWGLTPLEDQQLGGLIMWVPGSLVYVAVALVLLARWINAGNSPTNPATRSFLLPSCTATRPALHHARQPGSWW